MNLHFLLTTESTEANSSLNPKPDQQDGSCKRRETSARTFHCSFQASLSTYEVLAVLLEWVSEVHLRQSVIDQPAKPPECLSNPEYVQNKCLKVWLTVS